MNSKKSDISKRSRFTTNSKLSQSNLFKLFKKCR